MCMVCNRAQKHLDNVEPQGRAIDKAFRHELGPLACYTDLLALYQDRVQGITYQADPQMAELGRVLTVTSATAQLPRQQQSAAAG